MLDVGYYALATQISINACVHLVVHVGVHPILCFEIQRFTLFY
jgi:hypothetical protein